MLPTKEDFSRKSERAENAARHLLRKNRLERERTVLDILQRAGPASPLRALIEHELGIHRGGPVKIDRDIYALSDEELALVIKHCQSMLVTH